MKFIFSSIHMFCLVLGMVFPTLPSILWKWKSTYLQTIVNHTNTVVYVNVIRMPAHVSVWIVLLIEYTRNIIYFRILSINQSCKIVQVTMWTILLGIHIYIKNFFFFPQFCIYFFFVCACVLFFFSLVITSFHCTLGIKIKPKMF